VWFSLLEAPGLVGPVDQPRAQLTLADAHQLLRGIVQRHPVPVRLGLGGGRQRVVQIRAGSLAAVPEAVHPGTSGGKPRRYFHATYTAGRKFNCKKISTRFKLIIFIFRVDGWFWIFNGCAGTLRGSAVRIFAVEETSRSAVRVDRINVELTHGAYKHTALYFAINQRLSPITRPCNCETKIVSRKKQSHINTDVILIKNLSLLSARS
jgi:hypothetical protein